MKKMNIFNSLLVSLPVFLFTGCASYNAAPLSHLTPDMIQSSPSKSEEVVIVAKAFDKADCKKYLDRDVLEKGYQPIQLYIQNNSEKKYVFSLNRISQAFARPEEVAEKV